MKKNPQSGKLIEKVLTFFLLSYKKKCHTNTDNSFILLNPFKLFLIWNKIKAKKFLLVWPFRLGHWRLRLRIILGDEATKDSAWANEAWAREPRKKGGHCCKERWGSNQNTSHRHAKGKWAVQKSVLYLISHSYIWGFSYWLVVIQTHLSMNTVFP